MTPDQFFHFLMGGWIFPWFDSSAANGEGIDLDALLPPFELVIILAQAALLANLTGVSWRQRVRAIGQRLRPVKRTVQSSSLADVVTD